MTPREILAAACAAGESGLLETEGLALAETMGLGVPRHLIVAGADDVRAADLADLPGDRVVVKAVSRQLAHKSEVGAVCRVGKSREAVAEAIASMAARLEGRVAVPIESYGIFELVDHETGVTGELLLGMRWTPDFGPVVMIGPGGIETELLASSLAPGTATAILSPALLDGPDPARAVRAVLASRPVLRAATEPFRGRVPAMSLDDLTALVIRALEAAERWLPETLAELELNPVALTPRGPVALDAAGTLGSGEAVGTGAVEGPSRKGRHEKIARLLAPRSVAVMGVSERGENPGRTILRNMLRRGFPAERLIVVKPGEGEIEGCPRVADLASLPEPVDLLVLAVAADQVPEVMEEAVRLQAAESLVVIPGGLGETEGSDPRVRALRQTLEEVRETVWGGPVVNGGNCLGVRSVPGKVDTLFIPPHKLRFPVSPVADPLALVSQSGAFAIARASKLRTLNPRYLITVGNQLDLTVGDYVEHLVDDSESRVVACYVEGFRPGDGRRFLDAASRIVEQGRTVILYRAGRTAEGVRASASHTASIAGDFAVSRDLARAVGVVVAETLEDFEDLVGLFVRLNGKDPAGPRLGAVTNAGFEAVAIADRLGALELARFEESTRSRIAGLLEVRRLGEIVSIHNPLDVTPMMDDEGFAEAAVAVLDDPGVDLGVIGCVPLTGAMETVAPFAAEPSDSRERALEHSEDGTRDGGTARRLAALAESKKPWVAVVDSGHLYDPMVRILEDAGIPTFRLADRAARLLGVWAGQRLRYSGC